MAVSLFGQETSTTTKLPGASGQETLLNNALFNEMMPLLLSEEGYDVQKVALKPQDDTEYQALESNVRASEAARDKWIASGMPTAGSKYAGGSGGYRQSNVPTAEVQKRIRADYENDIKQNIDALNAREKKYTNDGLGYDYKITKKLPPGMTQEQYDTQQKTKTLLTQEYMEKSLKYLRGDFSITDEQKSYIKESMAPQRAAMEKMYSDIQTESEKMYNDLEKQIDSGKAAKEGKLGEIYKQQGKLAEDTFSKLQNTLSDAFTKTFKDFNDSAKREGMTFEQAMQGVGAQIDKSEISLQDAFSNTVKINQQLNQMNIKDTTGQVTRAVAQRAAAMGRDVGDPEFQNDIQKTITQEVSRANLQFGQMEAQGRLGIQSDIENQRIGLSQQRAQGQVGISSNLEQQLRGLSQNQMQANIGLQDQLGGYQRSLGEQYGQNMYGVTNEAEALRRGAVEQRGQSRIGLAASRGEGMSGLAQQEANLGFQLGGGMTPQQTGVAQSTQSYMDALRQQSVQNMQAGYGALSGAAGNFYNQRLNQGTQIQSQEEGLGSTILGGLTGLAKGASGFIR